MSWLTNDEFRYSELRYLATGQLPGSSQPPTPGPVMAQCISGSGFTAKLEKDTVPVPESARRVPGRILDEYCAAAIKGPEIERNHREYLRNLIETQDRQNAIVDLARQLTQQEPVRALRPVSAAEREAARLTPDDGWEQRFDDKPTYHPWAGEEVMIYVDSGIAKGFLSDIDTRIEREVSGAIAKLKSETAQIRAKKAARKALEAQSKSAATHSLPVSAARSPQQHNKYEINSPIAQPTSQGASASATPPGFFASLNGVALAPMGAIPPVGKWARIAQAQARQMDEVSQALDSAVARPETPAPNPDEQRLAGMRTRGRYATIGGPSAVPSASAASADVPRWKRPAPLSLAESSRDSSRHNAMSPSPVARSLREESMSAEEFLLTDLSDISHFVVNGQRVETNHFSKMGAQRDGFDEDDIEKAIRESLKTAGPGASSAASSGAASALPVPAAIAAAPAPTPQPKPVPLAVELGDLPTVTEGFEEVDEETRRAIEESMALNDQAVARRVLEEQQQREATANATALLAGAEAPMLERAESASDVESLSAQLVGNSDPFAQPILKQAQAGILDPSKQL